MIVIQELADFLIYQIDISSNFDGCKNSFIKNSLKNRTPKDSFYVPKIQDELVFRVVEYIKNPSKEHHYNYILQHILNFDNTIIKNSLTEEYYKYFLEKLSQKLKTNSKGVLHD